MAAIFSIFGAEKNGNWDSAPWLSVRGKWHGYEMHLNLADWSERQTWFLARYHELDLQLLMNACLRPGDRVIDVGANIGMLSLHAAWRVGPSVWSNRLSRTRNAASGFVRYSNVTRSNRCG